MGIEVPIQENDGPGVVAYALEYVLNNVYSSLFAATRKGDIVEITTRQLGIVEDSADFNTGFVIDNTPGDQRLVKTLELEYQGVDPVYLGQTLKNYYYNIFKGVFEKNTNLDIAVIWDEIQTTFPSTTSELYSYKLNGILVQTTLVNYQDSTKRIISSVEKTRV
jgi:hypothetical protein